MDNNKIADAFIEMLAGKREKIEVTGKMCKAIEEHTYESAKKKLKEQGISVYFESDDEIDEIIKTMDVEQVKIFAFRRAMSQVCELIEELIFMSDNDRMFKLAGARGQHDATLEYLYEAVPAIKEYADRHSPEETEDEEETEEISGVRVVSATMDDLKAAVEGTDNVKDFLRKLGVPIPEEDEEDEGEGNA